MHLPMRRLRPFLAEHRIFLMGGSMSSVADTGRTYRDDLQVNIQPGIVLEPYSTFWAGSGRSLVSMGAFSYTHSPLPHLVSVGRYSSIALGLRVMGESHPTEWLSTSPVFYNKRLMMSTYEQDFGVSADSLTYDQGSGAISIGNDVWIGENVTLARGITIGDGSIVATNATVTKDVPAYSVVGGLPARVLRPRFHEKTIEELSSVQWWQYAPHDLKGLDVRYPRDVAQLISERVENGTIKPFSPLTATYEDFISIKD